MVELKHTDCLQYMRGLPDKAFDLALVDPPYGIGQNWTKDRKAKFYKHRNGFNDSVPGQEYFDELFRISRHQIIWGCNYYWNFLPVTNNLIFWDKGKDAKKQFGSAGELAWTSITKYPLIKAEFMWNGCVVCEKTERIHPHQKPVMLYRWCLEHYAEPGWKILDTHLGSASSAIAAAQLGFDFVGCEREEEYYLKAVKRVDEILNNKIFQTADEGGREKRGQKNILFDVAS